MKRTMILLAMCLCAVLMVGCNTTGTFISATGAYVRAGPVTIVVGTVDASNSAGEFADEIVVVTHTTYFDTAIDTGASTGEAGVTAEKKSEYTFSVTPVKAEAEVLEE